MDQREFANRLKAGIGGSKLWRLRRKTAIATAHDLIAVGHNLLSNREIYAGAALLRQVTEIEYLTWAIKENHRSAENGLLVIVCACPTAKNIQRSILRQGLSRSL